MRTGVRRIFRVGAAASPMAPFPIVEKPQTDHREYGPLTLANGLRAIVISDSRCDKAAAALSVKVGSLFDPKERVGRAGARSSCAQFP